MSNDLHYLKRTLELAKLGEGKVSPNPMVGCVIVKNGRVIGEGHHKIYGGPHAEVVAIESASESIEGATVYVSLEPCCHTNKQTPPCAQRLVKEKVARVVIAALDPNEQVAGKGVEILKQAGIEVEYNFLVEEQNKLNEKYLVSMKEKRPFIHLKFAMTLDGKIATETGDSKWITDEEARAHVHYLRGTHDAVAVGMQTAIHDNPKLNVRFGHEANYPTPYRIVFGDEAMLPASHHLKSDSFKDMTLIYNLRKREIGEILSELYQQKIASILIEGGAQLHSYFLESGYVDKISAYIAPRILGKGLGPFDSIINQTISDSFQLEKPEIKMIGDQILYQTSIKR